MSLVMPNPMPQLASLAELFRLRVEKSPDKTAYYSFDATADAWQTLTWGTIAQRVGRCQKALLSTGLAAGDRVAIMLPNGPDWVVFDQAALGLGLVVVPLYYHDRPDNVVYCLGDAQASLLVIETCAQYQALLATGAAAPAGLRKVIVSGAVPEPPPDDLCQSLERWLPEEESALQCFAPGPDAPDTLATIVYTSGTTGSPKGVMLSHRNILHNVTAAQRQAPLRPADRLLSLLPLSHMLERTCGYYLPMLAGAEVSFTRSPQTIAQDLLSQKPTTLVCVPRIIERINNRIETRLAKAGWLSRAIFRCTVALGWKQFEYQQGRRRRSWFAALFYPLLQDRVGAKLMEQLGGRLRMAVCGGAALQPQIARTFIGLGLPLLQGYGLTETSPIVCANTLGVNIPGSVGKPWPDYEVSLADNGELLVRGPNVMLGYWKNQTATSAAIDPDGWLHTGDIASIKDGFVYITGRIKEIIVLANGEKVPPAEMEQAIEQAPLIEQALIHGEGKPFLSALIVLNPAVWQTLALELNLPSNDPASLENPRVTGAVQEIIRTSCKNFPGYARIHRFCLTLHPWTVGNGLLTPTLKLRREKVTSLFENDIKRMYAGH